MWSAFDQYSNTDSHGLSQSHAGNIFIYMKVTKWLLQFNYETLRLHKKSTGGFFIFLPNCSTEMHSVVFTIQGELCFL